MEPEESPNWCPRCGAAYEPLQEYCLECGERLPTNRGVVGVLASAWQRRFPWYPGDWVWPALLFLLLTIISTTAAVAASSSKGSSTLVATNPGVTVGPGVTTVPPQPTNTLPSAPQPTITTGQLPTAPGNTGVTTVAPAPTTTIAPKPVVTTVPAGAGGWPGGKSGYTDVLESIPHSAGFGRAQAVARRATASGLPQAGVLDSSRYGSLRDGYYVVFSGVYSNAAQAASALSSVHARGFPGAYEARVSR